MVQAVYLHLLVSASRNVTRGHADVTLEDIASALDVTEAEVRCVFDAMQGRVLDQFSVTGWETRQPKKEDAGDASTGAKSAAERKREERARKASVQCVTQSHDESRNVTLDKDKDKDKEKKKEEAQAPFVLPSWVPAEAWAGYTEMRARKRTPMTDRARDLRIAELKKFLDAGYDIGAILDKSTSNGWTDIYAPKDSPKPQNGNTSWLAGTGFETVAEAQNHRCHIGNAHEFRNRQRAEAHV